MRLGTHRLLKSGGHPFGESRRCRASCQGLFDIPEAQREEKIEPDSLLDDPEVGSDSQRRRGVSLRSSSGRKAPLIGEQN
jgi:hypothetical protein